jgi:signal transduction histidine kinase
LTFSAITVAAQSADQAVAKWIEESGRTQKPADALRTIRNATQYFDEANDSLKVQLLLKTGILYSKIYQNDSAQTLFRKALDIASAHQGWKLVEAELYNYLGNVSRSLSNGQLAMEYYNKGLISLSGLQSKERYVMETKLVGNIGGIYYDLEEFSKALDYAERGRDISIANDLRDHFEMDYLLVGFAARAAGQYEKALENNQKALEMMIANKDSSYLAHTYYNIASIHQLKKQWPQSLDNFEKAIGFSTMFGEAEVYISCQIAKAQIFLQQGDLASAFELAENAEQKSIENTFLPKVIEALAVKQEVLSKRGMFKEAYALQPRISLYKDSLYNIRSRENVNELETKYETARKEQTITQLEQENKIKDLQVAQDRQMNLGLSALAVCLVAVLGLSINRSRLKQRSAEVLDQKNRELQKANAFRDKLFTIISHDLKSPLSAFRTLTSSISQNLGSIEKEQLAYYLSELHHSSNEVYSTLNNLLAWSISQTNQLSFRPVMLPADKIVADMLAQLSAVIKQKAIRVRSDIEHGYDIYADENMMQIVIRNLLANAIKFSPENGQIEPGVRREGNSVIIFVRDHGIGISERDQDRLFKIDENVQSIGNSAEKGTGLGLLLCAELIKRHGGKIWVESEVGKGSTFYFSIPDSRV